MFFAQEPLIMFCAPALCYQVETALAIGEEA